MSCDHDCQQGRRCNGECRNNPIQDCDQDSFIPNAIKHIPVYVMAFLLGVTFSNNDFVLFVVFMGIFLLCLKGVNDGKN